MDVKLKANSCFMQSNLGRKPTLTVDSNVENFDLLAHRMVRET